MPKFYLIPIILSLSTSAFSSAVADTLSTWQDFLSDPNFAYEKIEKEVLQNNGCRFGGGFNDQVVPQPIRRTFFDQVSEGRDIVAEAGLQVIRCFDGGELADYYRSYGAFFEKKPERLITLAAKYEIPLSDIKRMVAMLPEETVDDVELMRQLLVIRLEAATSIASPEHEEIKNQLVFVLRQEIEEVNRHR